MIRNTKCSGNIAVFERTKGLKQLIADHTGISGNIAVFEHTKSLEKLVRNVVS